MRQMNVGRWRAVFGVPVFTVLLCAALVGVVVVRAQNTPVVSGRANTEPKATVDPAEVGLAGTIAAVRVTIAPGIMTADHTHTGRTSLFVLVEGTLTDVRGDARREYHAGDVVTVAEGVTHHAENHGPVPVVSDRAPRRLDTRTPDGDPR